MKYTFVSTGTQLFAGGIPANGETLQFGYFLFRPRARGQLSSTGDPLSRQGAWGWGIPPRSQVHAARSMPPVAAAVSQPGMPLRHSGHRACRQFS
ncbi:MAG TPA: hypothetical protein VMK12_13010, partial [Anaeromyxobacteraceae bacterium]|nr:hypothetical protein [Anaeromyxobacteraceae bacterium]